MTAEIGSLLLVGLVCIGLSVLGVRRRKSGGIKPDGLPLMPRGKGTIIKPDPPPRPPATRPRPEAPPPGTGMTKCPQCQREGLRSRVYCGESESTTMGSIRFYDEGGRFHDHDPNSTRARYSCSNDHQWWETTRRTCWCEEAQAPLIEPAALEPRCPVCTWPMAETAEEGCVPGNCSMRPQPRRAPLGR